MIDKVTDGSLSEADYNILECNIRADLGSGQPDLVKAYIEKFKRTLGLGIYKLQSGAWNFIVGSYGTENISWSEQEIKQRMYFTPVAPNMVLFCTNQPGRLVVTRQGTEGAETLHKMNTAIWNASQWVAATSRELLKAVEERCFTNLDGATHQEKEKKGSSPI